LENSRKQAATPRVQQNPVPRSGHDVNSDSEDDFVILSEDPSPQEDEKPCQESQSKSIKVNQQSITQV